jgi:hypothetical protein
MAIRKSKHSELFEEKPDTYMSAALLQKEGGEHEGTRFYFTFIFDNVQQFLRDFFSYQIRVILFFGLLFLFIVIVNN